MAGVADKVQLSYEAKLASEAESQSRSFIYLFLVWYLIR